jgi:glycosyltransferase involved in cell wall biosynthesis
MRILIVLNLPWDPRLGASRVFVELKKEWEKSGHEVERFCLSDAYPKPERSRLSAAWRQVFFGSRAADYIRHNANRFDAIDSLVGCLPFSKRTLRFKGVLVARSIGLHRLYTRFLKDSRARWPDQARGRPFGALLHRFLAWKSSHDAEASLRVCDLINVPNEDEEVELAGDSSLHARATVQPYGLTSDFRHSLAAAAAPALERLGNKMICFIGMWSPRKGSRDWAKIIAQIRQHQAGAKFLFLGTMYEERLVRADLGELADVTCRSSFTATELPAFLADCTLALFPSYIEGFGLAVLEQLAAGLPVVAYDVPGPRQILQPERNRLLVRVGDVAALSARANDIMNLAVSAYEELSANCRVIAQSYRWDQIAAATIDQYRQMLGSLRQPVRFG